MVQYTNYNTYLLLSHVYQIITYQAESTFRHTTCELQTDLHRNNPISKQYLIHIVSKLCSLNMLLNARTRDDVKWILKKCLVFH